MPTRIHPLCILIAALFITLLTAGQARALDIEEVRFGKHPDKLRVVVETSQPAQYRAFMLNNPARLTIDMPTFIWQAGEMQRPRGSGVENLRYGANRPGISRIVIDLSRPFRIQDSFALPAKEGYPPRVVIDLAPTDARGLQQVVNQTHGRLDIDKQDFAAKSAPKSSTLPRSNSAGPPPGDKPLIVIDPGHGGKDPGALAGDGTYEKNIVLPLGKELAAALKQTGRYRVKMTRENDRYIKLRERVDMAREWGGDMFISVHADSIEKRNVRGSSVYTLSNKASDAQTAKLAASENRSDMIAGVDLSHEDEEIADILIDLATRDTMNQSRYFANVLVDELKGQKVRTLENPHRYAGFAVLKAPDIPSILIEAGFVSNPDEVRLLRQPSYRAQIIQGIVAGVDNYFMRTALN